MTYAKKTSVESSIWLAVRSCVLCTVRESTKDVDGFFKPSQLIRKSAARVASRFMSHDTTTHDVDISENWLNDAVKGFLSESGDYCEFLLLSHLTLYVASPTYLLAMKCLAARIGEEFHDIDDIQYLVRHLNISSYQQAIDTISLYYPLARFPQKTMYLLQELLPTS